VPEIVMVADKLLIAHKHPRLDRLKTKIIGYRQGKVRPGEEFVYRGDLGTAPSAAHALDPDLQAEIEAARAKREHDRRTARLAKKHEAAAIQAEAAVAAAVNYRESRAASRPARKGWPKGKPRGPRKHTPEPAPSSPGEGS
jgi:hypothetical protein